MAPEHPHLDGLIVLGARLNPEGQPGRIARLRLLHALEVWRSRDSRCGLLLTGGRHPGTPGSEARAMADWSLDWVEQHWGGGLREQVAACLVLDEASLNTAASAVNTLPLVRARGWRRVGLVSDAFHLRRALYLFRRCFRPHGIVLHPLPAAGVFKQYWQRRRYLWLCKMALREGGAWLKVLSRRALGR